MRVKKILKNPALAFLCGALALLPHTATAQNLEQFLQRQLGTISATAQPQFNSGKLVGCGIVFGALARDWTYKSGGYVKIDGSVNLMIVGNGIGVTLKVVLQDIDKSTFALTPSPPATAYLISTDRTKTSSELLVSASTSDTPGALFSVFKSDAFPMLADAIADDRITIAFARTRGGQDVLVSIELDVLDIDNNGARKRASNKNSKEFFDCTAALVSAHRN